MKNGEDHIDLLDDRSLFRIWKRLNWTGRRGIKESKAGWWFLCCGSICGIAQAFIVDESWISAQVAFISLHGLKLSTGILSFLLSGFVFSLSAANATLLYQLVKVRDEETKLDFLRVETFTILAQFAEFVGATFVFAFFVLFGQPGGLLGTIANYVPDSVELGLKRVALLILNCIVLLLVVRLKSFVTNFYHFAMAALVIRFDDIEEQQIIEAAKTLGGRR